MSGVAFVIGCGLLGALIKSAAECIATALADFRRLGTTVHVHHHGGTRHAE